MSHDLSDEPLEAESSQTRSPAVAHRVDVEHGVVWVTLAGKLTVDALTAGYAALRADPAYANGMTLFVETRVLVSIPTPEELRTIALSSILHRADAPRGRVAIVAMTARAYEAASTFEFFCESANKLAVFTNPIEARAWLGLPAA